MAKKETGVMTQASKEQLDTLNSAYPVENTFSRTLLPRLGMVSQDVIEGKGKAMKVTSEAGTFFIEKQGDSIDDRGKKIWDREELGNEIEAIILFERKQLRHFDSSTNEYTSSPVYDNEEQVIPLFRNKTEIDHGTPKELRSREEYQGTSAKGKAISKLEENKILYVLYNGEVYQMNLRGSSMYSFMTYKRKSTPNTVVTRMNSESKENGAIAWNQMSFEAVRPINSKEADTVIQHVTEIRQSIADEKNFYAAKDPQNETERKALKEANDF